MTYSRLPEGWSKTHWKIEVLFGPQRWRQIGFPENEHQAWALFERAVEEYPADYLVRLREGERVCKVRPAVG